MKRILIIYVLLIAADSFAQDVHFSQMGYSPLTLNPALAGANHDMQAIINYKSQWQTVATPYKTMAASFDMRVGKLKTKSGFFATGLNVFKDQAGLAKLSTINADLSIAYHIRIDGKSTFGGALLGGYGQRSINPSGLSWSTQYDGVNYNSALASGENFGVTKIAYFDAGAGVVYTYKRHEHYMTKNDQRAYSAGLAVYHINRPNNSFIYDARLKMRIAVFGNAYYGIKNSHLALVPSFYYNVQGRQQEILAGTYLKKIVKEDSKYTHIIHSSAISAGVFYRHKDAIVVKAMFEKFHYSAGVAYDVNVSSLSEVSKRRGGFEVFIRFITPSPFAQAKARM